MNLQGSATLHEEADTDSRPLISAIASSNRAAMAEFYNRYQASVFKFAMTFLSDRFAASDVLNDVMLHVWKGASKYRGDASPQTWVLGITRNVAIQALRGRYRHAAEPLEAAEDLQSLGDDVSEAFDAIEGAQRINACVALLPESQKAVIHLAFYEELSYPEISALMDIPEGTVKSRVFHAKRFLKHCLGNAP